MPDDDGPDFGEWCLRIGAGLFFALFLTLFAAGVYWTWKALLAWNP